MSRAELLQDLVNHSFIAPNRKELFYQFAVKEVDRYGFQPTVKETKESLDRIALKFSIHHQTEKSEAIKEIIKRIDDQKDELSWTAAQLIIYLANKPLESKFIRLVSSPEIKSEEVTLEKFDGDHWKVRSLANSKCLDGRV